MDVKTTNNTNVTSVLSGPKWLIDLVRLLPIRSQFALSGNIRDSFVVPSDAGPVLLPLLDCLWDALKGRGYEFLLVYDKVDGARIYPGDKTLEERAEKALGIALQKGYLNTSPEKMLPFLHKAVSPSSPSRDAMEPLRCAVIIDYASRLSASPQTPADPEFKFFSACGVANIQSDHLVTEP
jgi:ATP-dependent Clp protease ATP-binding subunit ClpB